MILSSRVRQRRIVAGAVGLVEIEIQAAWLTRSVMVSNDNPGASTSYAKRARTHHTSPWYPNGIRLDNDAPRPRRHRPQQNPRKQA
jgi:hypothetical protein